MQDILTTLKVLVACCQRSHPDAIDVLLPDDDPAVEAELLKRASRDDGHITKHPWIEEHQALYAELKISWGRPSPDRRTLQSPWLDTLNPMHKSSLTLHQCRCIASAQTLRTRPSAQQHDRICEVLMIDVWPSPSRCRLSRKNELGLNRAPCMLPQQVIWLHIPERTQRLLLGREALLFQGYPISAVAQIADAVPELFLQDLAGNVVSLPVLLAIVQSTFLSVSWKPENVDVAQPSTNEEVDDALSLLTLSLPDTSSTD